jgi:glucosamine--fructose-6-phosphate aminotransferase (isomerizing)
MCGIVGYIGPKEAPPIVLSGLKRLEYRGYDSAGVAALEQTNGTIHLKIKRSEGKLENLVRSIVADPIKGTTSIGHTRWATHGRPSEKNAHPHRYKDVVVVHNGIIENYISLREDLKKHGHVFSSETDSEIVAHLLQREIDLEKDFEIACQKAVNKLQGAFALVVLYAKDPKKLFVAKQHCPMVLGLGKNEQFVASDIPALLEFTKDFVFLEDGEMAFVEASRVVVKTFAGKLVKIKPHHIDWSLSLAEKEGFDHFMLKEIYEQPRALRDTFRGRIRAKIDGVQFDTVKFTDKQWKDFKSIVLLACGTAWHASLVGKYWIEKFAQVHVDVDLASEFRYRDPVVFKNSLAVAVSQSGETADTLAAISEAIKLKMNALTVTNTVESSIARKTKSVIYTHAGPEIAVASTKAFTSQLGVLALLAVHLADKRGTQNKKWISKTLKDLAEVPEKISEVLKLNDQIKEIAKRYKDHRQYFYLGRGISYPMALEGALKLKEIAYINTQAYPAGEMKHGPIALISDEWPVICIAPNDKIYSKSLSNFEEVKARGGKLISIGTEGSSELQDRSDEWIGIPKIREEFSPFLTAAVLQMFAYHMSVLNGCDVDKPRNLAKSVTVE